ncbi:MAG: hypothetical protein KKD39_05175 [Candidatus Altiarchaeota archaeon]|nr:hypothetical protein [Candidatus Altiarchaeota archaeon]
MDANQIILGCVLLTLGVLVPGFAISLAIFPKRDSLNFVERAGLSMVFGFLPSFIAYFNAKNLSIPITDFTAPATIALTTLFASAVWAVRISRK